MKTSSYKGETPKTWFRHFALSDFAFIFAFGLVFLITASSARGFFTGDSFFVEPEVISHVIPIYATINVAIMSFAPVFVSHVRSNVKASISRKKRKKLGGAINGLLDSFCVGTIIWSIILLVLCVVNLAFYNSCLFAWVSSFELALLLISALSTSLMLRSTWAETFANKMLK